MRLRLIVLSAVVALLSSVAAGDVIRLKNGKVYEGKLIVETRNRVLFEIQKYGIPATLEFRRADVLSIRRGENLPPAPEPAPVPVQPVAPIVTTRPDSPAPAGDDEPAFEARDPDAAPPLEVLEALVRFRQSHPLPQDRKPRWADYDPMVTRDEENAFVNVYQEKYTRAWNARRGPAGNRLCYDLAAELRQHAADVSGRQPRLSRMLLIKALTITGRITADMGAFQEQLREDFLALLSLGPDNARDPRPRDQRQLNPRHLTGLLGWDLDAWQGSARVSRAMVKLRIERLGANAVPAVRWQIEYGQAQQAHLLVKNIRAAFNSVGRQMPDALYEAGLASRGLLLLAQRVKTQDEALKRNPADDSANKQMALNMTCYARDHGTALEYLGRVTDPAWKTLASAGQAEGGPRAVFLLAEGLAELARGPKSARPADFADPLPIHRSAMWCYQAFLDSGKGGPADVATARLQVARLGHVVAEAENKQRPTTMPDEEAGG